MDCALKSVCFHKNKATNFFIIDAMQENQSLISRYLDKQCPACGDTIAKMVFDAGVQPLATIAWAETGVEAKAVQSFKQEYVQCLNCSHIWNHLFNWEHLTYGNKPNKMYNN